MILPAGVRDIKCHGTLLANAFYSLRMFLDRNRPKVFCKCLEHAEMLSEHACCVPRH